MSNSDINPRVTLETRTNKGQDEEMRLRFRVRCGRDFQVYYKSGLRALVGDVRRYNADGTVRSGLRILPPQQLTDDIAEVIARLKKAAITAVERGITSSDEFQDLMLDKAVTGEKSTLLQDFADYIKERSTDDAKRRIADSSVQSYQSTLKLLDECLTGAGLASVTTQGFTADVLIGWLKFMGGRVSQNSRSVYSALLKKFFNDMESRDVVTVNPYNKRKDEIKALTAREKTDEPFALTLDELKLIAATDVPQRLQHTKDIFLMQCYIGCRVRDLERITMQDVKTHPEGFKYVSYLPQKTAKNRFKVETPLVPSAVAMLDAGVELPLRVPATTVHNEKVKALLHHCGINRTVEVWNRATCRYNDSPLWYVATSKICRRTAESLLTAYQVNMFTSGLHAVGSDAIKSYIDMSLTQRYRLMCAAYGEVAELDK